MDTEYFQDRVTSAILERAGIPCMSKPERETTISFCITWQDRVTNTILERAGIPSMSKPERETTISFCITWQDRVTNTILERAGIPSMYMYTLLKKRCMLWLGHVVHVDDGCIPKNCPRDRLQLVLLQIWLQK